MRLATLLTCSLLGLALPVLARDGAGVVWSIESERAWNGFAHQVLALPDVDGDGVDDLAVSVFGERRVEFRSGRSGELLHELHGPESFGLRMALMPAVEGGRAAALLVAAPLADGEQLDAGRVSLHALPGGELLWSRWGQREGARLGYSLHPAVGDELLASTHHGPFVRLAVDDGSPRGVTTAPGTARRPLARVVDRLAEEGFGRTRATLPDLDGDGVDDQLVADPGDDVAAPDAGAVHLLSGRTGAPLAVLFGEAAEERFGSVAGVLGDLDGDGRVEIFVGGYVLDASEAPRARLQVCSLSAFHGAESL